MAGKGNRPIYGVDWKKFNSSKLWDNIGPNSRNREKKSKPIPPEQKKTNNGRI